MKRRLTVLSSSVEAAMVFHWVVGKAGEPGEME